MAFMARNLRRRVENKHKGMSYPCSQCKHDATIVQVI